jgi:hypothetical protein
MKVFLVFVVSLFGYSLAINFVDIIMEEWQDWKLSHSN